MKKVQHFFLIVFSLVLTVNAFSQTKTISQRPFKTYAATLKVSTLGFGLEGITNISENINVRVGGHFFKFNLNGGETSDNYTYTADTRLLSFSALLDYYPASSIFKITGGILVNLNKLDFIFTPNNVLVNGRVYTSDELGNALTTTDFTKVAPYLGVGLFNPLASDRFGFTMDIGGIYQSAPTVTMTATKLMEPTASQADIIQENLKWFKFYPVVTLGLTYKFK
jgi:hypothetical protein